MDGGRIVEQGTHPALLVHKGVYARLWALQQEENRHELLEQEEATTRLA
jgi:ATP-binding cassette subfamily B protein